MLTESLMLALAGGFAGLFIAVWGVSGLLKLDPNALSRTDYITMDVRVLGFTIGVTLLTGVVFGLAPAINFANRYSSHSQRRFAKYIERNPIVKTHQNICRRAAGALACVAGGSRPAAEKFSGIVND